MNNFKDIVPKKYFFLINVRNQYKFGRKRLFTCLINGIQGKNLLINCSKQFDQ